MQSVFKRWQDKYRANILDMGGPLEPGGKILTTSGVTDRPFAEAKEIVGGYMLVSAESLDQAGFWDKGKEYGNTSIPLPATLPLAPGRPVALCRARLHVGVHQPRA